jgi:putative colanic acid biosynthesis acetyltransferase WcaF
MPRQVHYNAADHIPVETAMDPYLRPAFPLRQRIARLSWNICWAIFYRLSPRPLHGWRAMLLRLFGAKMGPHCHFYSTSRVWAPWNLICADQVTAGDGAEIYNPAPVRLGSHAILSQNSYLCGATHDSDDPGFPLLAYAMEVGAYAWVCARACVAPGVNVGEGAVLGLASVATRDLEPWGVYAGAPAVKVKQRSRVYGEASTSAKPLNYEA